MSNVAPVAAPAVNAIRIERACLATADATFLSDWKTFQANFIPDSPMQDPEWLRGYFLEDLDNITSFLLYDGTGAVCGSASFLLKDWPLKLHLGEVSVAELPLRRLRLLGGSSPLPEDESAYDLLFHELLDNPEYDTLHFAQVPTESFLWKYLTTSRLVGNSFYRYPLGKPSLHPRLRFGRSFEEYMKANFSKTHRHTLRRKVTRFQEEASGPVKLVRYTQPEEVTPFLSAAVQVSRTTYQWNLHQRGLRSTERFDRRYRFAAKHGWFRSYLLFCGDTPCAFLGGYHWRGRYYTDEIGFDPAFARHSPGTVLQMMCIEEMFASDSPELIDFGSYDKYKEEFSNDNYTHCDILLFRRRIYCGFARGAHYACRLITDGAVSALRGLNLKNKLKKTVRNRSVNAEQKTAVRREEQR